MISSPTQNLFLSPTVFLNIKNSQGRLEVNAEQVVRGSSYTVNGLELLQDPIVFSPECFASTAVFAREIPYPKNETFLEIGTGVGAIALTAAMQHQNQVVATDINSKAVEITQQNIEKYSLQEQVECRLGSLFEPIGQEEKFAMIFWNWPFLYASDDYEHASELEKAIIDPGYKQIESFLNQAQNYLEEGGKIILTFSSLGRRACFDALVEKAGYEKREIFSYVDGGRTYQLFELSI